LLALVRKLEGKPDSSLEAKGLNDVGDHSRRRD
jgi:hypothetical protein